MVANTKKTSESSNYLFGLVWLGAAIYGVYFALGWAYKIRILALEGYGYVIHEFDPYFNFRATEYLYNNGAERFFKWFDYMSWYPLGRPVGSTIYPGMQFTAVFLKNHIFPSMSLNDVCCSMPAWFGMLSTFLVGCIAYECSLPQNCNSSIWRFLVDIVKGTRTDPKPTGGRHMVFGLYSPSVECALGAMGFMAIVPAHLMRSVGGGYDNESVAVSAMSLTFYLWVRSLRGGEKYSYLFGILTGIAYFYMVAAWGGYVFVLNMVGVHAAALTIFGRFSFKVYAAYSLFYSIGTFLAMQIPVVGMTPLKSLEQMGPCLVFLGFQVLQLCEFLRKKRRLNRVDAWKLRIKVGMISAVVGIVMIYLILPKGYFGPISSRVRGLFVKHTKTGNPLVDSVAEHQAASPRAYFQYLHNLCLVAPVGFAFVFWNLSDSSSFLLTWGACAYFFSHKMVRLVLLTAPIGSVLGGIAAGRVLSWCIRTLWDDPAVVEEDTCEFMEEPAPAKNQKGDSNGNRQKIKKIIKKKGSNKQKSTFSAIEGLHVAFKDAAKSNEGVIIQRCLAAFLLVVMYIAASGFKTYCWQLAPQLSNPSIMMKGRLGDGNEVIVDDYRESYWWLRDNTPQDSRIMAWWDYGYQITAIANRTTIADGNTWNHEHIALLGKALTTTEDEGYEIARHLADYVLIWAGGGGDDLAKSPHLARIANSVYRDHCSDPACRGFGFTDRQGTPSVMMERSFLYKLHGHNMANGVKANARYFQEVFRSKYGKVRIFKILGVSQESKDWVANPENRLCDVPGSWYCPGQYPPGLQDILSRKTDFAQLEDFNRGNRGQSDEQYQKEYFEALANPKKAVDKAREWEVSREKKVVEDAKKNPVETQEEEPKPKPTQEQINEVNGKWENSEASTLMWELITNGQIDSIEAWLKREPLAAFVRSEDGRGPMWWAFESRNQEIVKLLMRAGVSHGDTDKYGKKPASLLDP